MRYLFVKSVDILLLFTYPDYIYGTYTLTNHQLPKQNILYNYYKYLLVKLLTKDNEIGA